MRGKMTMRFDESKHPRDKDGKFTDGNGTDKKAYDSRDTFGNMLRNMPQGAKERVTEIRSRTEKPKFGGVKTPEFVDALTDAKATVAKERPQDSWRVSSPSAEEFEQEHPGAVMHVTQGGSTVAVTPDGDIVGLCKKPSDSIKGKDLLKTAVENGGRKLDAFSGLYGFYITNGFEPVSWTPFDEEYAPSDWHAGYKKEPVIFWKYTGKESSLSLEDFFKNTQSSESYDEAKNKRDKELEDDV